MEFDTSQNIIKFDDNAQTITISHTHDKSLTKTSPQTIPYQAISNYTITGRALPGIRKLSLEFPNCPPCPRYSLDPYSVFLKAKTINELKSELDRAIATTGHTTWRPTARIHYLRRYSDQKSFYKDFAYTDPKLTYDVSINNDDYCNQDVVGGHYHLDTYKKIIELNKAQPRAPFFVEVQLILEPDNPYAENGHAISVRWNNKLIGYIPQRDAHPYWQLARIAASGYTPTTNCRIYYKRSRNGEIYVWPSVSLRPPHALAPLNNPPHCAWALIPRKNRITVTKTYNHTDTLLDFLPPSGEGELFATFEEQRVGTKTKHSILTVKIDGEQVGALSKAMSEAVLPLFKHFENTGIELVAIARIKGSSLAATLTLDACKSHEVSDTFLDAPHLSPLPRLAPFEPDPDLYQVPDCYLALPNTVIQTTSVELTGTVAEDPIKEEELVASTPSNDSHALFEERYFRYAVPEKPRVEPEQAATEPISSESNPESYDQMQPPPILTNPTVSVADGQFDSVKPVEPVGHQAKRRRGRDTSTPKRPSRLLTAALDALIGFNVIGLIVSLFSDDATTRENVGTSILILSLTIAFVYFAYCRHKDAKTWKVWTAKELERTQTLSQLTEDDELLREALAEPAAYVKRPRYWKVWLLVVAIGFVVDAIIIGTR